jgi:hypothetical protein
VVVVPPAVKEYPNLDWNPVSADEVVAVDVADEVSFPT